MPVPPADSLALEIYEGPLAPYVQQDSAHDHFFGTFLTALMLGAEEIATLVRDDPVTGAVGWSKLLDVDVTPEWALPWLAQLVGVKDDLALTVAERRQRIKVRAGSGRGTVAAIEQAPKPFLTGTKTVTVTERLGGDPWALGVETLAAETPDEARVEAAILEQKPAGILLTYSAV